MFLTQQTHQSADSLCALIFSLLKTGIWLKINVRDLPVLLPNIWLLYVLGFFCFFSPRPLKISSEQIRIVDAPG